MDFEFSEEQRVLKDSLQKFLTDKYSLDVRRTASASDPGFSAEMWRAFADMGWLALPFSEEAGGLGCGAVETMILMEAFGRHLVVEPYLPSVVLAGGLVDRLGTPAQIEAHLPALMAGERLMAFAHSEPDAGYALSHVEALATPDGSGGYVLTGRKTVVLGGDTADTLVVSARTGGETADGEGITLFLVERAAENLGIQGFPTVDGGRAAEIRLDGVAVGGDAVLGVVDGAFAEIERAVDIACTALNAEAMGAIDALYTQTREYLSTRKQFGAPLISFQELQHRLVDMFIAWQETVSLVYAATLSLDAGRDERIRTTSAAKARIGQLGKKVSQEAVQLHGGMGMTDELAIGHYFKRLLAIDAIFGNVDYHRKRFSSLK